MSGDGETGETGDEILGDEFPAEVIAEAKKWGWKPPEEWHGDPPPRGFQDPDEFLETPRVQNRILTTKFDSLQASMDGRISKIQQMAEEANKREIEQLKANHERTIAEIRAAQRDAVETGDVEEFDRQADRLKEAQEKAPAVKTEAPTDDAGLRAAQQKFASENPWFNTDPIAAAVARTAAGQAGGTPENQFKAAVEAVHKRFPEYAPQKPKVNKVDGGGLGGGPAKKSHKDKLPPEAKADGERYIKRGLFKDMDEYAASYFDLNDGAPE